MSHRRKNPVDQTAGRATLRQPVGLGERRVRPSRRGDRWPAGRRSKGARTLSPGPGAQAEGAADPLALPAKADRALHHQVLDQLAHGRERLLSPAQLVAVLPDPHHEDQASVGVGRKAVGRLPTHGPAGREPFFPL